MQNLSKYIKIAKQIAAFLAGFAAAILLIAEKYEVVFPEKKEDVTDIEHEPINT